MNKRFPILLVAFLLGLGYLAAGQTVEVTGQVTNKTNNEPLVGATITVDGVKNSGTTTNEKGQFRIFVPSGATLNFTYVGMTTSRYKVSGPAANLIIQLGSEEATQTEVVVIGYGTQKVTKVSGAIATIKQGDIAKINPVRVEEALQGRAAGVNVIQGGAPGSNPSIVVRGIPSYSGNSAPIVVVDGVQQSISDLNSINPADIESISVLKDAATTAIYGVKGGNGVVVVTTKSGRKNMKPEFSLSANYGIQEVTQYLGVLNATEYGAMINEASTLAGGGVIFPNLSTLGVGTNWQKEVFRRTPLQNYSLAVRGGAEKVNYFLSAGYASQGGIVGGFDKSNFNRGNFTSNLSVDLTSKLKFTLNTTGVIMNSRAVQENSFNSILGSAINFDPTVPKYNTDASLVGTYGFSNRILSEVFNPLTKLENTFNRSNGFKLYGKFELAYKISKNLTATSRFGYTKWDATARSFTPLAFYGPLNVENTMNGDGSTVAGKHNSVDHNKYSNFNFSWENFLNYNLSLGNHDFETVIGMAAAKTTGNASGASRQDVPFNSWEFADFTAATGNNTATNTNALSGYYYQYFSKNLSMFGRINYDYQERYLASVTMRRDGSTAFGKNNRYANLMSGSVGWLVSNENFYTSKTINLLKLRASYGAVGNDQVSPQFSSIVTGGPSYGPTANSNGYNFDNIFYSGATLGSMANNDLKWEISKQINAGIDLGFFKNNVTLSVDYFERNVGNLLFQPRLPLYLGTIPPPSANIGSTKGNGIEAILSLSHKSKKSFGISSSFTFTKVKSKVTETNEDGSSKILGGWYFNGQSNSVTVFEKGQEPWYFFGWKTAGLFQSWDEISKSPAQPGAQPGDVKFVDINGDNQINASDKTYIGSAFPDFTIGWNFNVEFKGFDLNVFTYASSGNEIYRAYERNQNYTNKERSVLARWTGAGSTNDARYPRYSFTDANSNIRVSDRYVEDGSFIKVKNVQLGYNLPSSRISRVFKSARLYAQVRNAFTFTNYDGFDPEINAGLSDIGIDRGSYPQARTFALGLELKW